MTGAIRRLTHLAALAVLCMGGLAACTGDEATQAIAYRPVQTMSLAQERAIVERDAQSLIFALTELSTTSQLPANGVILLDEGTMRIAAPGQTVTRSGLQITDGTVLAAGYTGPDGAWCIAMQHGKAQSVQAFPAMVGEASSCMEGGAPLP